LSENTIFLQDYIRVKRDRPTFLEAANGNVLIVLSIIDVYFDFEVLEYSKNENLELVKVSDLLSEIDNLIPFLDVEKNI